MVWIANSRVLFDAFLGPATLEVESIVVQRYTLGVFCDAGRRLTLAEVISPATRVTAQSCSKKNTPTVLEFIKTY